MQILPLLTLGITLSVTTTAHPLHKPNSQSQSHSHSKALATTALTESQLLTIAPTSNTCDNAPAAGECAARNTGGQERTALPMTSVMGDP